MDARHVFLSYCRDNAKLVAKLREDLIVGGERVWWDQEILPGQDWRQAIRQAMKASYAVVLCLSKETEARDTSGIYPEALDAIEFYREYGPGRIFLIPVRLSKCEIPALRITASDYLDSLQAVDLFPPSRRGQGIEQLLKSLRAATQRPDLPDAATPPASPTPQAGHPVLQITTASDVRDDTDGIRRYVDDLRKENGTIGIRGLQVGTGRAYSFPIDKLYISLTTASDTEMLDRGQESDPPDGMPSEHDRNIDLQRTLRHPRLVIVGDPGSGKTTFLRRLAFELCRQHKILGCAPQDVRSDELEEDPSASDAPFCQSLVQNSLPIFIRLAALHGCIEKHGKDADSPTHSGSAAWLPYHLAEVGCNDHQWGLDRDFFHQALEKGRCTVLLDGMDEAPDRRARETLSKLIEDAAKTFDRCQFVVTSRPAAYTEGAVLPGFAHAVIDPLSDEAVTSYLSRWCEVLLPGQQAAAVRHRDELLRAIELRPEIRDMVRTPVMLTALAVVHWNERRLPEQRADLYKSIITWLSRSRDQRPGRISADQTVKRLGELALAMQVYPDGRQTQVPQDWAARQLAARFADQPNPHEAATVFLHDEELDSGIIVGRGREIRFWHLTFQEYLAAKTIEGMRELRQKELLLGRDRRVYRGEWREVVLLLAGILCESGSDRVDGLVEAILSDLFDEPELLEQQPPLDKQAECVGLLGAIRRDLSPYGYIPADPRYEQLMDNVMAIFDVEGSRSVPLPTRVTAAEALGRAGDPRPGVGLRTDNAALPDILWCDVPGGTLQMGVAEGDPDAKEGRILPDGRPLPVQIDPFRLSAYPVTCAQFRPFVTGDGYQNREYWTEAGWAWCERNERTQPDKWEDPRWNIDNHPVIGVSWYEAVAWCRWLTRKLRGAGALADDRPIRLPTEAEWEWAARGPDGLRYPWGDAWGEGCCNNKDAQIGHTSAVGLFPAGAGRWLEDRTGVSCCDLAGNVWEWCSTKWRDSYAEPPDEGLEGNAGRVVRGGCWADTAQDVVCVGRYRTLPDWGWPLGGGFRFAQ